MRLFERADEWVPLPRLSELARSPQAARLELARLASAGVVEVDTSVRPHAYRISSSAPLSEPLRDLVERTVGVEPLLRQALGALDGVRAAAVHGSWARRDLTPESDVDLLVLVDVGFDIGLLREVEREVERRTGRSLDPIVFGVEEARRKLRDGSGFLRTVLDGPLVPLVDDVREVLTAVPH